MKIGSIFLTLSIFVTLGLFLLGRGTLQGLWGAPFLLLAQISALVGTVLFSYTFILSSRLPQLETLFGGLDRVYKIHRLLGSLSFILLLEHPIFLAVNRFPEAKAALLYFWPSGRLDYTLGILSLGVMVILIVATLYMNLPYHVWKKSHEFFGLALLLGGAHAMLISSDISRFLPLRIWILGHVGLALYATIYKLVLYRWFGPRFRYTVQTIRRWDDVVEITAIPEERPLSFFPGQFAFVRINSDLIGREEHPFTLACDGTGDRLRFLIKGIGDYTLKLGAIKVGDGITVWGPYGSFGERFYCKKDVVCIAGGIGITPFVSLLHTESKQIDTHRRVHLFYLTRSKLDAYLLDELSALGNSCSRLSIVHQESGIQGRLTGKGILQRIPHLGDCRIFLCGPQQMMQSLTDQLVMLGMPRRQIIYEDFLFK